jgi:Putative peptidoglycan binding domain
VFPLLLLIPGGLLLWSFAKRHAEKQHLLAAKRYLPPSPLFERYRPSSSQLAIHSHSPHSRRSRGVVTTADYLRHLHEATMAARILDTVKPIALAGDIESLMQSPENVAMALEILSAPLEIAFAQKDLNVLGAAPPLAEDGVLNAATASAISAIQERFGQEVTGDMDPATAATIRYAVGCIHAQDRAMAGV